MTHLTFQFVVILYFLTFLQSSRYAIQRHLSGAMCWWFLPPVVCKKNGAMHSNVKQNVDCYRHQISIRFFNYESESGIQSRYISCPVSTASLGTKTISTRSPVKTWVSDIRNSYRAFDVKKKSCIRSVGVVGVVKCTSINGRGLHLFSAWFVSKFRSTLL